MILARMWKCEEDGIMLADEADYEAHTALNPTHHPRPIG